MLAKIAKPLGFDGGELLRLAGYLTEEPKATEPMPEGHLDPLVAGLLAQEPVEVQKMAWALAVMMKSVASTTMRNVPDRLPFALRAARLS